jgi:hypothetical protein
MHTIHPVFHISMLELSTPNEFKNRIQPPAPPIIIDGEPEYEISKILDSKINKQRKCKLQYLVKWAGYKGTDEETSWLTASELEHPSEAISGFHRKYPSKPGPLTS